MNDNDATKVLRYRWLVFAAMALAYVFVYFHRMCPSVVAVNIQQSFEASASVVGIMASAYFYPYALMQFPAGLLSDSLGPRKTVTLFLLIAAVGSLLFATATSMAAAVVARVLVGIGVAMVFIPTMKINSQWFRVTEFSFMAAILNTMGGVGTLTAATPLAWVTELLGWRWAFGIIGLGTLGTAILVYLFVRNRPQDMGWPSLAEIDHIGPGLAAPPQKIGLWEGARRVVSEPRFWAIAVWFFFVCGAFFSFAGLWAGHYLVDVYNLSIEEKGNVLSMSAVGLIVGSPIMSLLSDRVFKSRKKVMIMSTAGLVCVLGLLNIVPSGLPYWSLYLIFFFFCVFASSIVVIAFTTTKELFPVEIAGTSVGTVNLFPFLGGAVMQIVLGRILDAYGKVGEGMYPMEAYSAMLFVLLLSGVVALVSILFMKETFPVPPRNV